VKNSSVFNVMKCNSHTKRNNVAVVTAYNGCSRIFDCRKFIFISFVKSTGCNTSFLTFMAHFFSYFVFMRFGFEIKHSPAQITTIIKKHICSLLDAISTLGNENQFHFKGQPSRRSWAASMIIIKSFPKSAARD
jgi:hypothetical protein